LKILVLFLPVICLCSAATALPAADWHVYVSGSGTAATIAEAAELASTGDVIYIHAGTYTETDILFDGKDVTIVTPDGRVYVNAPVDGSGTCVTIRNATSAFWFENLYFAHFDSALSIVDASPLVQFITIGDCGTGIAVEGVSSPFIGYSVIDTCTTAIHIAGGTGISLRNLTVVGCSEGVSIAGGDAAVTRNIIYGCGTGLACVGGSVTLTCNDLFANTVQYDGCAPGPTDFALDPIFCFYTPPSTNPYYLHSDSPCLPAAEPCGPGSYLGFNPTVGCTGPGVEESVWSKIKSLYR
jgi:hypothetical protein